MKNYITHDAVQKFHQSESLDEQIAPKKALQGKAMLSIHLNISILYILAHFEINLKYIFYRNNQHL